MRRREFILVFGTGVVTCALGCESESQSPGTDAGTADGNAAVDASPAQGSLDACVRDVVRMHDTYAQALYFDGSLGPLTGIVTVAHVVAGMTVTMDFWHGHGGQLHRFTLEPEHFAALKRGERVTVATTVVDGHSHLLFVDPEDEAYRVPGAPDVEVALDC